VTYVADPGESNRVGVTFDGDHFVIEDPGATITAGEGCEVLDGAAAHRVSCVADTDFRRWITLDLGDMSDTLVASIPLDQAGSIAASGQDGDDQLDVRARNAYVSGGAGDDRITIDSELQGDADGGIGNDELTSAEHPAPANRDALPQTVRGGDGNDRIEGHGVRDRLIGDAGDDVITGGPARDEIFGGPGNDELHGGVGGDELHGDEGSDFIDGGGGDGGSRSQSGYAIAGAALDVDELDGGPGPDVLSGGPGDFDRVLYTSRRAPVSVTLDGLANDGEAGEGDFVAADVEDVYGGAGSDLLVGNAGPNTLVGGAGDDVIDGRGGYQDSAIGGDGNDTLLFRDGGLEALRGVEGALPGFAFDDLVQCDSYARFPAPGDDTAFVDPTDTGQAGGLASAETPCEHVVMSGAPQALPVQRDGTITVPIGCGAGLPSSSCAGDATVRLPRARGAARKVPQPNGRRLAVRHFKMHRGRVKKVKVRLNKAGRRAARGHRRLRSWVTYRYE
jgi:serralysin